MSLSETTTPQVELKVEQQKPDEDRLRVTTNVWSEEGRKIKPVDDDKRNLP